MTRDDVGYLMTGSAPRRALRLSPALGRAWVRGAPLQGLGRSSGLAALGLGVFALVLLVFGKNPLRAYADIFTSTLGSWYGLSETLVKMIPLVLAAVAVAVPGKIWLINVGGEGQLHIGALFATWGALTFGHWPGWLLLPVMAALGFLGGGLWAALAGVLRARGWVSETISTLLLNYVAILLVSFFVFGPWKDPEGVNYPQTAEFAPAATLPTLGASRVHLGAGVRGRGGAAVRVRDGADALGPRDARHRRQRRRRRGAPVFRSAGTSSCSCSSGAASRASPGWARSRPCRAGSGRACLPGTATRGS